MQNALELLEWPTLFERLLAQCWTPYGIRCWEAEPFFSKARDIETHLAQVEVLKTLLIRYGEPIVASDMPDIGLILKRLAKGGVLTQSELRQVLIVLQEGGRLCRHVRKNQKTESEAVDLLDVLAGDAEHRAADIPDDVLAYLNERLDASGDLKDSASPQLALLRKKLIGDRQAIQQKCQGYLHNGDIAQALQSPTITEREGRYVLPVKVELKSRVPGIIHGASATGATLYVEPQGLVELNNRLAATQADLRREIERLIREICQRLEAEVERLERFLDLLGALDKRMAAARLSRMLDATVTIVTQEQQSLDLKKARHPLLVLQSTDRRAIVANDIRLGAEDIRTLLITGPNTGGKTVLLKTLGLFALMLRAGLHLPVAEGSAMAIFDPVLADIGDQQSIAQNLSTFSAHMMRLKAFVSDETDLTRALVLIDEIAAGTDPAEGAALARAILDELHRKSALTVVTTHLGELKVEAHQHPGYLNASVEFNPETLSPTYRLMMGVPGTSNAITIAQKLGLKLDVVERAKAALSAPVRESAQLIEELEVKNRQLEEELQKAKSYRLSAQESYEKLEWERQELEAEKRRTLKTMRTGLKSRIHDLESQVKQIRKDVQQEKIRDPERTVRRLKRLAGAADEELAESKFIEPHATLGLQDIRLGERLYSKQLDISGEVVAIQAGSNEVVLQAGLLRVTVPVSDLERESRRHRRKEKAVGSGRLGSSNQGGSRVVLSAKDVRSECDVRGKNAEEALETVQKFLDDAVLVGYESVGIIHGLGTGVLKREIRAYLNTLGFVKRFYPAEATQGGDGKTVVEL